MRLLIVLLSLVSLGCSRGDSKLARVQLEAAKLRAAQSKLSTQPLRDALRDWAESRFPDTNIQNELKQALGESADQILQFTIVHYPQAPGFRFVEIHIAVAGGSQDSLYVYRGSTRVLDAVSTRESDQMLTGVYMTKDLVMTTREGISGGSSWNMISYDLFRFGGSRFEPLFSGRHGAWFGSDSPFRAKLTDQDLLLQFTDRSIDPSVHSRTHILHYSIGPKGLQRIAPFALQPQDFVEEWVSRPWNEVESETQADQRDCLKKVHAMVHSDSVFGDYLLVQYCDEKPDHTQVGIDFHGKDGKEAPTLHFLVHDLGKYKYEMVAAESERQPGCPGEGEALTGHYPSLFPADK